MAYVVGDDTEKLVSEEDVKDALKPLAPSRS
jgi:hypothetical protein